MECVHAVLCGGGRVAVRGDSWVAWCARRVLATGPFRRRKPQAPSWQVAFGTPPGVGAVALARPLWVPPTVHFRVRSRVAFDCPSQLCVEGGQAGSVVPSHNWAKRRLGGCLVPVPGWCCQGCFRLVLIPHRSCTVSAHGSPFSSSWVSIEWGGRCVAASRRRIAPYRREASQR